MTSRTGAFLALMKEKTRARTQEFCTKSEKNRKFLQKNVFLFVSFKTFLYFCTEFEFEDMTNAKFSFYLPPHFFFVDGDKKLHFASMKPERSVTVQELFDYIRNDKDAERTTSELRLMTDAEVPHFEKRRVTQAEFEALNTPDVPHYTNAKPDGDGVVWVHYAEQDGTVSGKKQFKNTRFCFIQAAGVFTGRKLSDLQTPSGFVCVDFDHFAETPEQLAQAKDELLADDKARPVLVFTSPSGDGLKALFCFDYTDDAEENEARLRGLYAYLKSKHDWKEHGTDRSALDGYSDFNHCCNVPHDPDARLCLDGFTDLDWTFWRVEKERRTTSAFVPSDFEEVKAKYYTDELLRAGIDITDGMTWNEYVGLAHAFKSLANGELLFQAVSSLWHKYTERNTRAVWNYAQRQNSKIDVAHFYNLAQEAGIQTFEKSGLPEAEASVQAWKEAQEKQRQSQKQMKENKEAAAVTGTKTVQAPKADEIRKQQDALALTAKELVEIVCKKRDFDELIQEAAKIAPSVPTKYVFGTETEKEPFTLKAQALTVIGAGTSHGKTRFLENILLQVAEVETKDVTGTSLFFTLEEGLSDVLAELVNINAGEQDVTHEDGVNNFTAYANTFKRMANEAENKRFFEDTNEFEAAKASVLAFRDKYTDTDLLRIIDDERFRDVDFLCTACKAFAEEHKLKAVFLDHLGMMTERGVSSSVAKTERVERIVTKLELLAKELNVPFVLTCQTNRQAAGAFSLENGNLADSADVERSANTVVLLWNSSVLPFGYSEVQLQKMDGSVSAGKSLTEHGFFYGTRGALFAKLTKRRGGLRDVWTVFDFNGGTGRITDMTPERVKELEERHKDKAGAAKDAAEVAKLPADGKTTYTDRNGKIHIKAKNKRNGEVVHYSFSPKDFEEYKQRKTDDGAQTFDFEEAREALNGTQAASQEVTPGLTAQQYNDVLTPENVEAFNKQFEQDPFGADDQTGAAEAEELPTDGLPF